MGKTVNELLQSIVTEKDVLIDKAANLYEAGWEAHQQLMSELHHTYWKLNGNYGIAHQTRQLNQITIELEEIEAQLDLHHNTVTF